MNNQIIVASHRRSGTHVTIDSIINNIDEFVNNPIVSVENFDRLFSLVRLGRMTLDELKAKLYNHVCILKTHAHGNIADFYKGAGELSLFASHLFDQAKIIYVHRDGRDVLISLYYYMQRFEPEIAKMSIRDFIKMTNEFDSDTYEGEMDRVAYWAFHISSWMNKENILILSYKEFECNYEETLIKISRFLDKNLIKDTRNIFIKDGTKLQIILRKIKSKYLPKQLRPTQHTSVSFRKGGGGDWRLHFSQDAIQFFDNRAKQINELLGY